MQLYPGTCKLFCTSFGNYLQNTFQTDDSYLEFLNSLRKRSAYDFKINLDSGSKILTLSTCNDLDDGRLVVHAKLK